MFTFDSIVNSKFVIGLLSIFLVNYVIKSLIKLLRLPPGPWGLPFVGYLPFVRKDTYLHFDELSKKYGSVYSLRIGSFDVVVISGWPAIKEALLNDDLLARPGDGFWTVIGENLSLLEMSGDDWKVHRRVALFTLRNVGMGKTKMEEDIKEEIQCFIDKLKGQVNRSIDIGIELAQSLPNNISILLFGHKFDYNDPEKIKLDENFRKLSSSSTMINFIIFIPWTAKLLMSFMTLALPGFIKFLNEIYDFIGKEIDRHPINQNDEVNDYVDGFLHEMKKHSNEVNTTFTLTTLKQNAAAFYSAGSDTSQQSLNWIMQILATHPECQVKIREEIYQVIGRNRTADNVDRKLMPYTMAFIYESERHASLAPLNLPRCASKDTFVEGKLIPKGTVVYFNFWSVHRDPELYPNPEKFDPTRFLNEDHSKATKPPHMVAFSGGKRACPGESLAQLQIFLYLVNIIQNFEIKHASPEATLESKFSFLRSPKNPVRIILTEIEP